MEYKTVEYDGLTNQSIERDATADEIKEIKRLQTKMEAIKVAKKEQMTAKTALLEKLGITEDEARLLLS